MGDAKLSLYKIASLSEMPAVEPKGPSSHQRPFAEKYNPRHQGWTRGMYQKDPEELKLLYSFMPVVFIWAP